MRFGPFDLDRRTWSLTRDREAVDLSPRLVEILAHLASRPGEIVTKEEQLDRFWPDVHVTENTLTRAIADIRKALNDSAESPSYIQTLARRGYRFIGAPESSISPEYRTPSTEHRTPNTPHSDPFRDWADGRLALESLDETRLAAARQAFDRAASELPDYAPAQAGRGSRQCSPRWRLAPGNQPRGSAP